MLESIGESGPPCGVPSSTGTFVPSGITTDAVSIRRIKVIILWSVTRWAIRAVPGPSLFFLGLGTVLSVAVPILWR